MPCRVQSRVNEERSHSAWKRMRHALARSSVSIRGRKREKDNSSDDDDVDGLINGPVHGYDLLYDDAGSMPQANQEHGGSGSADQEEPEGRSGTWGTGWKSGSFAFERNNKWCPCQTRSTSFYLSQGRTLSTRTTSYSRWYVCSSNTNMLLFGGVMQQMIVVAIAQEPEKLSQMLTFLTAIPSSYGSACCVRLLRCLLRSSAERTGGGGGLPPALLKKPARSRKMQLCLVLL